MIPRLIDSVIMIDHLNGVEAATRFISAIDPEKTSLSAITWAEILVGVEEDHMDLVKSFLNQYRFLMIDKPVTELAAQMRRQFRWKLPDAFQAALAVHHKLTFTTRNTKDFDPKRHGFVEVPYSNPVSPEV